MLCSVHYYSVFNLGYNTGKCMRGIYSSDQLWPPKHREKYLPVVVPVAVRTAYCPDGPFTRNYKRR